MTRRHDFRCAIFDLDGVIVNTVPIHFKAWKKMFEEYGKKFTFKDYLKKVDGARAILTDLPGKKLKESADKKQQYFLEFLRKSKIPVFNSTLRFIKKLRTNNIKIAVVSSSKNCHHILQRARLLKLFDTELTGNDITKGKPDPQIFLMTAKRTGVERKNCIVFEDALLGVEAAKRAGMLCVSIDRQNKPERLKEADIIVKDLKEVNLNLLESMFRKHR